MILSELVFLRCCVAVICGWRSASCRSEATTVTPLPGAAVLSDAAVSSSSVSCRTGRCRSCCKELVFARELPQELPLCWLPLRKWRGAAGRPTRSELLPCVLVCGLEERIGELQRCACYCTAKLLCVLPPNCCSVLLCRRLRQAFPVQAVGWLAGCPINCKVS